MSEFTCISQKKNLVLQECIRGNYQNAIRETTLKVAINYLEKKIVFGLLKVSFCVIAGNPVYKKKIKREKNIYTKYRIRFGVSELEI